VTGPIRSLSAGIADRRRWRWCAGVVYVYSRSSPLLVLRFTHVDLGVMPVVWRWGLDLFGQIGLRLGFLFSGWFLQWPEVLARKRSTIFVNKAGGPAGAMLRRGSSIPSLPLSCRGGEGRCGGEAFLDL
jgi:hypothetical protein